MSHIIFLLNRGVEYNGMAEYVLGYEHDYRLLEVANIT